MDLIALLTRLLEPLRPDELRQLGARLARDPAQTAELERLADRPAAMRQTLILWWKWTPGAAPFHHLLDLRPDLTAALQQHLDLAELPLEEADRADLRRRPGPDLVGASPEVQALSEQLQAAYEALDRAGQAGDEATVSTLRARILALRRAIRAGPALKAGEFLGDGRYRLTERLGHGGYATVWGAWDQRLRRSVALKVLHHQHSDDQSRIERFFRGARLMQSLQHPGVVRVLEPRRSDEGFDYFVMERMNGGDLHRAVREGNLPTDEALRHVLAVADALAHAHRQDIVHRDVKPQNILLDGRGRAALSDFDLVKAADTTGGTRSGALGTFMYAAPEALQDGRGAGTAADQFSLAMTAIFCVYRDDIPAEALYERDHFLAALPCSEPMRNVLRRGTAIQPRRRFADVGELAAALRRAAEGGGSVEAQAPGAPPGYGRITERLRRVPADQKSFEIQFSDIEQWMNHPLPAAARRERSWWANDGGEVSRAWLDAGFRVGELNVTQGRVTWQRLFGREAEYIRFFGEIIREIRRQDSKAPLLDSPNGQSYHPFFYLRHRGQGAVTLRAAFDRGGELRVEIYLDTGDKESTKALFMELMRHRRALESAAEASLVWEELPDNRASRVYLTVQRHGGEAPLGSDNRAVLAAALLLGLHAELTQLLPSLNTFFRL